MSSASKPPRHSSVESKTDLPSPHEEMASLREADKIPYLPLSEFMKKDHFFFDEKSEPLGAGTTGKVFPSGTKYAVKQYPEDTQFIEITTELNIYASVIHPCILRPVAWTVNGNLAYLAMRKGESISDAYNHIPSKISIEQ